MIAAVSKIFIVLIVLPRSFILHWFTTWYSVVVQSNHYSISLCEIICILFYLSKASIGCIHILGTGYFIFREVWVQFIDFLAWFHSFSHHIFSCLISCEFSKSMALCYIWLVIFIFFMFVSASFRYLDQLEMHIWRSQSLLLVQLTHDSILKNHLFGQC